MLLIEYIGTVVLEVAFCCLSLFCFETSLLVQLLQLSLQPNENDPVLSGCMCLELAPGAAAQKWMSINYLPDEALSLCLLFFFFYNHAFLTFVQS